MKKIFAAFMTVLLIALVAIPTFAEENIKKSINVKANYVSSADKGEYTSDVSDGKAEVDAGGVTVSVSNAPSDAVKLVVVPIPKSEKETYLWFAECLKGKGTPIAAYDIYFLNAEGERISAEGAIVAVSSPDSDGEIALFSLTSNGKISDLDFKIKNGNVIFVADNGKYFVFAEKKNSDVTEPKTDDADNPEAGTSDNSQTEAPTGSGSPSTGQASSLLAWSILAFAVLCLVYVKKKASAKN